MRHVLMRGSPCPIPAICRRRRGSRTGRDFPPSTRANGCAFYCRCVHAPSISFVQPRAKLYRIGYLDAAFARPRSTRLSPAGLLKSSVTAFTIACRRCAVVRVAIRRATELNFTPDAPYRCYEPSESRRSGEYAGFLLGNLTVITVPSSSCKASSLMVALCWSAISLTIARPRPLPLDSLPGIR